jgi:hypothetical protein
MSSRKKKNNNNNGGWTVVKAKPQFRRVPVKLPPEFLKDLSPLERAVYKMLANATNGTTYTAAEIVQSITKCSKGDVGDVLYGRLKSFVEAQDWKERPRRWRLRTMKVKVG